MEILGLIIKTFVTYFVIMFLSTNLLGLFVRGILPSVQKDLDGNLIETDRTSARSIIITISSLIISLIYIYILYKYLNFGIAIAGIIIMISRLPDLLLEMKTGDKKAYKDLIKKPIGILTSALDWGAVPLIYYSFCCLSQNKKGI